MGKMAKHAPENPANIVALCPEHAPKAGKYAGHDPFEFLHCFVKKAFTAKNGRIEHMWVKVRTVNPKGQLVGRLDNEPVNDCGVNYDDVVHLEVAEIEEVIRPERTK